MILDKIVKLCEQNNTNISRVERELKLGKGTIRRWSTNQPTVGNLVLVANFFNVTLDFFLKDEIQSNEEDWEILKLINGFSKEQKDLLKFYISILKQTV